MNVIFIDDSKSFMEPLLKAQSDNDGKSLFVDLSENSMTPITIFFGNHDNQFLTDDTMGQDELNEFLDDFTRVLSSEGFDYDRNTPGECIYIKKNGEEYVKVDVNKSARLLYEDKTDKIAKRILSGWDEDVKPSLCYIAETKKYSSDIINEFLAKLEENIANDDVVLIDMLLIQDDDNRLSINTDVANISDKPILSMIIYHYLTVVRAKPIKCIVFSTHTYKTLFTKRWVEIYDNFYGTCLCEQNFGIYERQKLTANDIKSIKNSEDS